MRGLDIDKGGEFLNETLVAYCVSQGIELTRSRPYRKNDQAWVEQKTALLSGDLSAIDGSKGPLRRPFWRYIPHPGYL